MSKNTKEIEKECESDLKEIAHFYGGWDELRKVIDRLQENANEAAYERYTSDLSAPDNAEIAHRLHEIQKLK